MADVFTLEGSWATAPSSDADESLDPILGTVIDETAALTNKIGPADYTLSADAPVSVALGPLTGVNVLIVKVLSSRKAKVRVTSADGSTQAIPVDGVLILMSMSVQMTAIDLTRVAGVGTTVRVFLGQTG